MSVIEKREISTAEAKKLLEAQGEDLDPLQRRVFDYTVKFSKISTEDASILVEELTEDDLIDRSLAVQIVNCMPASIEEIRTFIGRQRIVSEEAVKSILKIIEKYISG